MVLFKRKKRKIFHCPEGGITLKVLSSDCNCPGSRANINLLTFMFQKKMLVKKNMCGLVMIMVIEGDKETRLLVK